CRADGAVRAGPPTARPRDECRAARGCLRHGLHAAGVDPAGKAEIPTVDPTVVLVDPHGGSMLDIRRVRFLAELADRGTLAAFAEALNYSPSAVAQHVHALERELGVALVEPVGRRGQLTGPARVPGRHAPRALPH